MGTGLIIMLIVLGIILILVEILLIPGFASPAFSVWIPVLACYFGFTHLGPRAGVIIIVGEVILLSVLLYYALRQNLEKLSLHTNIDSKVDEHPETKGLTAGMEGSHHRLNPMGRAK